MRIEIELTPEQVADLRRRLGTEGGDCDLVDTAEAARRLGTSVEYVRDHAAALQGVKVGRHWRFDPVKLREGAGTQPPTAPEPSKPARRPRAKTESSEPFLLRIRRSGPYAASIKKQPPAAR